MSILSRNNLPFSRTALLLLTFAGVCCSCSHAQDPYPGPPAEKLQDYARQLQGLQQQLDTLAEQERFQRADHAALLIDAAVHAKAAAWILRFHEFPKPDYAEQLQQVLAEGRRRCELLEQGREDWNLRVGTSIRGYISAVDGSVQPYAITLPKGVNPQSGDRWPLHIVLHGRADQMNEVNFIARMDGRRPQNAEEENQQWIQLDVYGRGNNAYRWAGETDVFEAFADVRRRFRIDENRVTLRGFSMGGAGAWHLGLHHPHLWSSVGPGAGFVDFYAYQKQDPVRDRRPFAQHETLQIYDAVNYSLNAFNVPVCTYGGENDPQLLASTTIQQAAAERNVDLTLLVGPGMGHKFDPESFRSYMKFHMENSERGRPRFGARRKIRFSTHTLKYSQCDWLQIQEVDQVYQESTVEAEITAEDLLMIDTRNVRLLTIARDVAAAVQLDGELLPLREAADGLLPDVWFARGEDGWSLLGYAASRAASGNPEVRKRPGLQGPIDDAFMSSFVAVRGTGTAANPAAGRWAEQQLELFREEYARWMRADIRVINDSEVTADHMEQNHLILFGDIGSNSLIAKLFTGDSFSQVSQNGGESNMVRRASPPLNWDQRQISIAEHSWSSDGHGLCAIFPNPFNPRKYVVLNSGHTFHEQDFRASNAWLFPRLGDVAVFQLQPEMNLRTAEPLWSDVFSSDWTVRGKAGE